MARKVKDDDEIIEYKDGGGGFTASPFEGKVVMLIPDYEDFKGSPAQARHIAKKLIQFADDIDKEK